jgi:hypothetical protein
MTRRVVAFAAAAFALGCSSTPPQKAEPVAVSGVVLLPSGQPAKDVTLNVFPTSASQTPAAAQLKADGKFSVKLVPGSYTFAFEGRAAGLTAVPKKYHQNEADHKFEVPSGGKSDATIQLQN